MMDRSKFIPLTICAIVVVGIAAASSSDQKTNTPSPSPSAVKSTMPTPTARDKLEAAITDLDALVLSTTPDQVTVDAKTPEGGFDGASTGDLNRAAGEIFKAI